MFRDRVACWLDERCQVAKNHYAHFTALAQANTHTMGRFWGYILMAGFYLLLAEIYYRFHEWLTLSARTKTGIGK